MRHGLIAITLLAGCATQGSPTPPQDPVPPPVPAGQGRQPQQAKRSTRVVVTARKYEELPQDVPRSISSIGAGRIEDAGLQSVRDASLFVPNMLVTEFTSRRLSLPYVRGIGSGQGDPAVATFIDGVPQLTTNTTNLPLTDVERIEFIRGPLGALYGRNTIGGGINIVTKLPDNRTRADAAASFGNFRYQDYQVTFSAPIVEDELFMSLSGVHSERDGYTDNDLTGNDVDFRDSWYGRGQLLWAPDENNQLRLVIHGERARDGGFVLSELKALRARPNHINQDFEGRADRDVIAGSLTWDHSTSSTEFTSITGLQDWSIDETSDFDFSFIDGVRRFTMEEQTALTQEFRFGSADDSEIVLGDGAKLRWLAGVTGFYSSSDREAANVFRPAGAGVLFPPNRVGTDRATGSFEDHALGVYGQATVMVGEQVELTGALRYDYERKRAAINRRFETPVITLPVAGTNQTETFDEVLPRFSASYRFSEQVMTYGVVARGFKAGGFNLTAPTGKEAFGTETSWTYEAGVKTSWPEANVTANAAVFYIDWNDMQLSQFDAASGGFVTNAAEARSHGAEVEVTAEPAEGLDLFAAFGWLDTEFQRFIDQFGQDVSGRNLPFAPDMTWSFGAQYRRPISDELDVLVRGEYQHIGEFFYDAGNRGKEEYGIANFRVGIGNADWRIEGWIRNAFDEEYVPVAFQPNPTDPTAFVGESTAPRTFGLTLRLRF